MSSKPLPGVSSFVAAMDLIFSGILCELGAILFCHSIPEFISAHIHNVPHDSGNASKVCIKDARGSI